MSAVIRITEHAIDRFRERIENIPDADIVLEMLRCLTTAKPKHMRNLHRTTHYIPTDRCLFVVSQGAIVTVLPRGHTFKRQAGK